MEKVVRMPKSAKLRYIYYIDKHDQTASEHNFISLNYTKIAALLKIVKERTKYAQLE